MADPECRTNVPRTVTHPSMKQIAPFGNPMQSVVLPNPLLRTKKIGESLPGDHSSMIDGMEKVVISPMITLTGRLAALVVA